MSNKTEKNLRDAFAGESQANRKYLAFARKAEEEGYTGVAKLFRAAAEAETIHAHSHLKVLGGIKSTAENLKAAFEGESYEFNEMYPKFIEEARAEGNDAAVRSFRYASEAEKGHAELYKKALAELNEKPFVSYYLCPVCGHIAQGNPPDKCPICGTPANKYRLVE